MNTDGTGFYTCKECCQTESLWNHITTDHKEEEQLEDRRNIGENSCNSGDGTDQSVQSWMFMMMIVYLHEVVNLKHFYQLQFSWLLFSNIKRATLPGYEVILISVQRKVLTFDFQSFERFTALLKLYLCTTSCIMLRAKQHLYSELSNSSEMWCRYWFDYKLG